MIVDSLVIDPDQASAAMGYNRKAMLDFFDELISREQGQGQGQGQGPALISQNVEPLAEQDLVQMTTD